MKHILYLVIFFVCGNAVGADISVKEKRIKFEGEIVRGDYSRLLTAINEKNSRSEYLIKIGKYNKQPEWMSKGIITINSGGGDVVEAMKLGRLIREKEYGIEVLGKCYSSCVYLLAAGLTRFAPAGFAAFIQVGIHRPFFTVPRGEQTDAAMKQMLERSRRYFEVMNINPSLADDMFSIPPGDINILDEEELTKYRLNQRDMAYNEILEIESAKDFGMTRFEYMEARKRFREDTNKYCVAKTVAELEGIEKCYENFHYKHGLFEPTKKN